MQEGETRGIRVGAGIEADVEQRSQSANRLSEWRCTISNGRAGSSEEGRAVPCRSAEHERVSKGEGRQRGGDPHLGTLWNGIGYEEDCVCVVDAPDLRSDESSGSDGAAVAPCPETGRNNKP
jgi:hypothetical protein